MSKLTGGRIALFSALMIVFLSFTVADHNNQEFSNWDMQIMGHPYSFSEVSNGSNGVQVVNLTTNGKIITPEQLSGKAQWHFNGTGFNETGGNLTYLRDGLWYMNGLLPTESNGTVTFEAQGITVSDTMADSQGIEVNATRHLIYGNLTVDVLTFEDLNVSDAYLFNISFSETTSIGKIKAGKEVTFEVNVWDAFNQQNEANAEVYVWFTNGSWVSEPQEIANYNNNSQYYYNDRVKIPAGTNTTYIAHVNASSGSNYNGVESFVFQTHPAIKGYISRINASSRCAPLSMPDSCEPGARIATTLNITAATANKANLTLMLRNATGLYPYSTQRMDKAGSAFTTEFTVPRMNNTKWDDELIVRYNASNEDRSLILTHNITVETFFIRDETDLTAYQGQKFPIEIFFGRPITLDTYPKDMMDNATVTIRDSDSDIFTQFNLSHMTFDNDSGIWTNEITLPANVSNATYTIDVEAYDVYGVRKELDPSSGFRVRNITKSFDFEDEQSFYINKTGEFTRNISFENLIGSETVIWFNLTGDIADVTSIGNGSNISLPGSSTKDVPFHFNINTVQDYTGNATFYDSSTGFNETMVLTVDAPDCGTRNGTLCTDWSGWMNITTDQRQEISKFVNLYYIGEFNTSTRITTEVTGKAGNYVEVKESNFTLEDSENITIEFIADRPIDAKGKIVFNGTENETMLVVPTYFTVNVTPLDTNMELSPAEIDFGVVPDGSSFSTSIEVNNTGSLDLSNFSASSDSFTVSIDSGNVSAGETSELALEITGISSESGTIDLSADSRRDSITRGLSVTGTVMPTFDEINSELSQRIRELETSTSDPTLAQEVSSVNTMISDIQTQMDQENYETALETYNEAQNTLDSLEQQINEQNAGSPNNPGNNTQNPGGSPGDNPNGGGGFPVVLLAVLLFVLLVVGFIAYTSIIPEEGDPLYNVLGGE